MRGREGERNGGMDVFVCLCLSENRKGGTGGYIDDIEGRTKGGWTIMNLSKVPNIIHSSIHKRRNMKYE